jgi:hypothetical protein
MRFLSILAVSFGSAVALTVPDGVEEIQRSLASESQQTPALVRGNTAASIKRTTWDPPAQLISPLKMVWGNYTFEKTHKNWAFQQIYANKGKTLKFWCS